MTIDQKYRVLQEVMQGYYGVREKLHAFLEEICRPYKNWEFIVKEAKNYAFNYLPEIRIHPKGPEAAQLYLDIFFQAIDSSKDEKTRINAADNLLLFIQRLIEGLNTELYRFLPVLDYGFDRIRGHSKETFFLFVKTFYQLSRLGKIYSQAVPPASRSIAINRLLIKYYRYTYEYWLSQGDPLIWFERDSGKPVNKEVLGDIFKPISSRQLTAYQERLEAIAQASDKDPSATLERLTELPGYGHIVSAYSEVPKRLIAVDGNTGQGNQKKLIFLLHMMNIAGLSSIHEEALREINRTLAWLIHHDDPVLIRQALEKTFAILKMSAEKFPETALNCVLNIGQEIYKTNDSDLVDFFIGLVVSLGFQAPGIEGVGDDWQVRSNSAHIQNVRTWVRLIELNPKWSKKLLSSLIIHLSLTGVLIKDTDLFPRDITQLLNSDIGPVYNLAKQLARLFPTYFNDIGAEGRLRDISTRIDEVCLCKDPLIHFLRKQSHVESSNQIVRSMEATLDFWRTRDRDGIRPFVPPHIYQQIETEGPYIDGVHQVINYLLDAEGLTDVTEFLNIDPNHLDRLPDIPGTSGLDLERVKLAVNFYRLLYQKYHTGFTEIHSYLQQLQSSGLPDLKKLKEALKKEDITQRLRGILDYLGKLKEIILSSEGYEIKEEIYRKRHFTVNIPSMYGSYHEMKFDALGLTFRLESLINVLFEEIVETIDLKLITRPTFSQIYSYLLLFHQALELDGISSLEMGEQLEMLAHSLKIRGFSSTQYLDIFRSLSQTVRNITNEYFNNIHQENLSKILDQIPIERLRPKYLPFKKGNGWGKLIHRVTEIFLRDRIATSLGLQQLDIFLSHILTTLYHQSDELPKEELRLLLSYNPQKAMTPISPVKEGLSDIIHLGNKGLNLARIKEYGLPVPPGFIVTTEAFRCREIIDHYAPARKSFEERIRHKVNRLENLTGKTLGDLHRPLLLAVRSGSAISQPGMMDSFLNVGINEDIVQGMVVQTGNEWFAWDTYRRFLQSYGMAFGLKRDDFDNIITDFKRRLVKSYKKDFTGPEMREVALTYKSLIRDSGIEIEESPFKQLFLSIRKVFDSWNAPKAETYRKIMGISDDWGTAVTVQAMVFGNVSRDSGAGVFFTHSPRRSRDTLMLWGDFTLGNQGEDVVAGLVRTLPISKRQAEIENRGDTTLEILFPEIYQAIRGWAKELVYTRKWSPQEMEFTFEGPDAKDLYCLQTRDMVMREREKVYSFDLVQRIPANFLGHGIGVSGGAMTGRVVFSLEEIQHWRKAEPGTSLVLVRNDTVPDDIREVYGADGLLTARGGSTSHAAIVAHRLGKTCVVGCADLICSETERTCSLDQRVLKSGDWISIDGTEGSIYLGQMKIREMERY